MFHLEILFPIVWACSLVYKLEPGSMGRSAGGFSVVSEPPSSPPHKRGTSWGGEGWNQFYKLNPLLL
jgi:hypothetical protein